MSMAAAGDYLYVVNKNNTIAKIAFEMPKTSDCKKKCKKEKVCYDYKSCREEKAHIRENCYPKHDEHSD